MRGLGLMWAIEFQEPPGGSRTWKLLERIQPGLFAQLVIVPLFREHRILSQVAGHGMNVLKAIPPLVVTEEDVDWFVERARRDDRPRREDAARARPLRPRRRPRRPRAEAQARPRKGYGLELGDFGVAVGDAAAGPGVRGLDQAAAEHVELALVLGQLLRRDLDPHLVQRRLSFGADLVTVLGDDRDLADLREQRRREVVDLGGRSRRVPRRRRS